MCSTWYCRGCQPEHGITDLRKGIFVCSGRHLCLLIKATQSGPSMQTRWGNGASECISASSAIWATAVGKPSTVSAKQLLEGRAGYRRTDQSTLIAFLLCRNVLLYRKPRIRQDSVFRNAATTSCWFTPRRLCSQVNVVRRIAA